MAKSKRIWRESQHPRDAKGRFSRRGGAAWIKRAGAEVAAQAGSGETRTATGRPRISRQAKAGVTLQAHADGGRPSPVRVPQATVTPVASPKNLAAFTAKRLPAQKRTPRPSPAAAAMLAARNEEQAPHVPAMVAARAVPEAAPVNGAEAYTAMRRHTLLALARDAKIGIRGKSNTQIANELAAHDAKVKADRAAKLNPSGVGTSSDEKYLARVRENGTDPSIARQIRNEPLIIPKKLQKLPKAARTNPPERTTGIRAGAVAADGTVTTPDGKVIGRLSDSADVNADGWALVNTDTEPAMRIAGDRAGAGFSVRVWLDKSTQRPAVDTPRANSQDGGMTSTTPRKQIPRDTKAAVMAREGRAVKGVDMTDPQRWSRGDAKYRFGNAARNEAQGFGGQSTLTDEQRKEMREAVDAFSRIPNWETQRLDVAARRIQVFRDRDEANKANFTESRGRVVAAARAAGTIDAETAAADRVKAIKKQHKIPGDAAIKRLPDGVRQLAEGIVFDAKNAARTRAAAENNKRSDKVLRAELARTDLTPHTREQTERLHRNVLAGANAEGADRTDAELAEKIAVWDALRTAAVGFEGDPGQPSWDFEVMPGNGLTRRQAEELTYVGRAGGPRLAERAAASLREKAAPASTTPRFQTFADRMRGEFTDAERLEMSLKREEESQRLRAQEAEAARLRAEARANDTRPEREKLKEQLDQDREMDRSDMRSGRRNPQRLARIKKLEARIEELDTEDRKAKIKDIRKGDKVKTTYGGETIEVEVVGKTSDGYLRVLLPNGKRGSLNPKHIEGVTPAPKAETVKAPEPAAPKVEIPEAEIDALIRGNGQFPDEFTLEQKRQWMEGYRKLHGTAKPQAQNDVSPTVKALRDRIRGIELDREFADVHGDRMGGDEDEQARAKVAARKELADLKAKLLEAERAERGYNLTPSRAFAKLSDDALDRAIKAARPGTKKLEDLRNERDARAAARFKAARPKADAAPVAAPARGRISPDAKRGAIARQASSTPRDIGGIEELKPFRIDRPQDGYDAHGTPVRPGDTVTIATDRHNRTDEKVRVLDVGIGRSGGSALATVQYANGDREQLLLGNLVRTDTVEGHYLDNLTAELAGDERAGRSLRGQPSAADLIRSIRGKSFNYQAAALQKEARKHPGPLGDRLNQAADDLIRLGRGTADRSVVDRSLRSVDTLRVKSQNGGMTQTPSLPSDGSARIADTWNRNRYIGRTVAEVNADHAAQLQARADRDAADSRRIEDEENARRNTPQPTTAPVAPLVSREEMEARNQAFQAAKAAARAHAYTGEISADRDARVNDKALTDHVRTLVLSFNSFDEARENGYDDSNTPVQVGDEVLVTTGNKIRRGIVTGTSRNGTNEGRTRVMYSTPSGAREFNETTQPTRDLMRLVDPSRRPREDRTALLPKLTPEARAPRVVTDEEKQAKKDAEKAAAAKRRQDFFNEKITRITAALNGERFSNTPEWHLQMTTEEGLVSLAKHLGVRVPNREKNHLGFPKPRDHDALVASIIEAIRQRSAEGKA